MSCELDLGIPDVVERCWQELKLIRLYTKRFVSRPHTQPTSPKRKSMIHSSILPRTNPTT